MYSCPHNEVIFVQFETAGKCHQHNTHEPKAPLFITSHQTTVISVCSPASLSWPVLPPIGHHGSRSHLRNLINLRLKLD